MMSGPRAIKTSTGSDYFMSSWADQQNLEFVEFQPKKKKPAIVKFVKSTDFGKLEKTRAINLWEGHGIVLA